jgi:polyisoprenyl-teichoic acid--peptidoglycan teichoic acid transferase
MVSSKKGTQTRPNKSENQTKKKHKNKKKSSGGWLWVWLGLTGVSMLSATAGALLAVSLSGSPLQQKALTAKEEGVFAQEQAIAYNNLRLPELSRPVNILILGTKVLSSDVNEPVKENLGYHTLVNSFDGLSDTMLLLRFDPQHQKLIVLSIPRDTRAYIEGHGETKINEANAEGGPALAAKTISELLGGLPIDRYLRVNVQGVGKLIDALGGVEVYVPKEMKYQDDSQRFYVNLAQGQQHLDGERALQFLRFRYDSLGDIGRVQRQQILMRALVEQTLKPTTLMRTPKIIEVIKSNLDTNLTVEELMALGGFAAQMKRSDLQMLMLPGGFSGDGKKEVSYWLPSQRGIRQMMASHFGQIDQLTTETEAINPARVRIAIQDSTGDQQSVEKIISQLKEAGYNQVYLGDPWSEPLQKTRIIAQSGDEASASALRSTLGVGEVLVESTGSLASDITIQIGKDW